MSYNDDGGFSESPSREYGGNRGYGGGQRFEDNRSKPVETGKEYPITE